jgi:hypothetical protein
MLGTGLALSPPHTICRVGKRSYSQLQNDPSPPQDQVKYIIKDPQRTVSKSLLFLKIVFIFFFSFTIVFSLLNLIWSYILFLLFNFMYFYLANRFLSLAHFTFSPVFFLLLFFKVPLAIPFPFSPFPA